MTGPRPNRNPWTAREATWLQENYVRLGAAECARQLGRSKGSVSSMASRLALSNKRERRKYQTTEQIDREIRELYSRGVRPGDVRALAEQINRPDWWIERRAREIGAKPVRGGDYSPWTEEETELLYSTIGLTPEHAAQRFRQAGYPRSVRAIQRRRWQLRVQPEDGGYYTVAQVAELLGAHENTIRSWIRKELLRAEAHGQNAAHEGCRHYRIKDTDLGRFLAAHPLEWDMRKVADQVWLVDLLTNGKVA